MNNKPPLEKSSFVDLPQTPSSPLCYPSPKLNKNQRHELCTCKPTQKSHYVSTIGIILLVLAYTFIGSILFVTLEGEKEEATTIETSVAASKPYPSLDLMANVDIRARAVERLWSITEDLNILYKENWTRLAAQEVQHFQDTLLHELRLSRVQQLGLQTTTIPHNWTYASAFLYSITLITTIGYGGIAPRTQWGRIASIMYALFGIPIILLYLSAMGNGLSKVMQSLFRGKRSSTASMSSSSGSKNKIQPPHTNIIDKENYIKYKNTNEQNYTPNVPITICILILICYVTLGAMLFHEIQPWGVLESLYFCFSSLGTIGFGDLMPNGDMPQYVASSYILIGMAVVAMCFSLIQTELLIWLRKFSVQDMESLKVDDISMASVKVKPPKS